MINCLEARLVRAHNEYFLFDNIIFALDGDCDLPQKFSNPYVNLFSNQTDLKR